MPQPFADDRNGNLHLTGNGRPGMAGDIRRQMAFEAEQGGKLFQVFVVVTQCTAITKLEFNL